MPEESMRPWPGPRPFSSRERHLLFGRKADLDELVSAVHGYPVVELVAGSGVGKTSLLSAGLMPALVDRGEIPILCPWQAGSDTSGFETYCRAVLRGLLDLSAMASNDVSNVVVPRLGGGDEDRLHREISELEALFEDDSVPTPRRFRALINVVRQLTRPLLIFDQIEELLRRDERLGEQFLDAVADAAKDWSGLRQLIALRSEYARFLKRIEAELGAEGFMYRELKPVPDEAVNDLIARPAMVCDVNVDADVVATIAEWWRSAREGADKGGMDRAAPRMKMGRDVGLLHLQAILDALWDTSTQAGTGETIAIGKEDLRRFEQSISKEEFGDEHSGGLTGERIVRSALRRWLRKKAGGTDADRSHDRWLLLAKEAVSSLDLGDWDWQVRVSIFRMSRYLSSGGFKIANEVGVLAWLSHEDAFRSLGYSELEVSSGVGALWRGQEPTPTAFPKGRDGGEASSWLAGSARELSHDAVATLICLAFLAGLERLMHGYVMRAPPVLGGQVLVELVHDGFGPVLNELADDMAVDPRVAINSLTAIRGEDLLWKELVETEVHRANWLGCWISGLGGGSLIIRDTMFAETTLRGSVFAGSELKNVTFADCDLRGAIFRDCRLENVRFEGGALSALTFQSCAAGPTRDQGVAFRGGVAAGVTLDCSHGVWRIEDGCTWRHFSVVGEGTGHLVIEKSELRQPYVDPRWQGKVDIDLEGAEVDLPDPRDLVARTEEEAGAEKSSGVMSIARDSNGSPAGS